MPDDALVINRAAELPDLLSRAISGLPYETLQRLANSRSQALIQGAYLEQFQMLERTLAALGVGQPEPVTERDVLRLVSDPDKALDGPARRLLKAARIERVLEGKKP